MTLRQSVEAFGNAARPFAIYAIAASTAWAIFKEHDSGLVIQAGIILVALYGARSVENGFAARKAAEVQVAKVEAGK